MEHMSDPENGRPKSGKWLYVILAVLTGGMAWGVTACGRKSAKPTFKEVTVTRQDLTLSVESTGNVQPENRVEIKPPVSGRAERVLVQEGERVWKGQVLAYLSSLERAALLDAARAKGPDEVKHWEDLYKATPLLAPLDGRIILRNVEPGQTVGASDTVLVLSDRLIVNAQVDETDIGKVQVDQPVRLTLDAYPDQVLEAKVRRIGYEARTVNNVTMYDVVVLPKKVPSFMRSGMTVNVTFITAERKDVLVVPSEAVKARDGRSAVLRPGSGKRPDRQEVETGLSDGKMTEVLSGLDEGATVLVAQFAMPGKSGAVSGTNPFMPQRPGRTGSRSGSGGSRSGSSGGPPPPH
jgi:macrolide-specific efflux system membrane fusion protein